MRRSPILVAGMSVLAPITLAAPPLGGEMNHSMIGFDGASVTLHVERGDIMQMLPPQTSFTGAESVLNDMIYNGQYGWLVDGFWAPPAGTSVWIEQTKADDRLSVYLGRSYFGQPYFTPIFGTDGSSPRIRWDGAMLHNYYVAPTPGYFEAKYEVYIGDASGERLPQYAPAKITFRWQQGLFDVDFDGDVDIDDLYTQLDPTLAQDVDGNGVVDAADGRALEYELRRNEFKDMINGRR